MNFISGINREQYFIGCLDDTIDENNLVRFIDAYVSQLDIKKLGFKNSEPQETGRPAYSPQDLLKLYIYGYLNKIRSSRNLERESYRNIELIWLINGLHPDHKTIARFRQNNPKALKNVFKDFVKLCMKFELYGKELIAVDGSKFKAWNSKDNNFTRGKIDDRIRRIDEKIDLYMAKLDLLDQKASEHELYGEQNKETEKNIKSAIDTLQARKNTLEEYKVTVNSGEETQISLTDTDSRLMKTKNGMAVCLNVQTAVDSKNKMVVEFEVVNQVQDKNMMAPMAKKAAEILEADNMTIVADNGYDCVSDVAEVLAGNNIPVVAGGDYEFLYPTTETEAENITTYDEAIAKSVYLPSKNIYICPMGQPLYPLCYVTSKHIARYGNTKACKNCPKKCTKQKCYYAEKMMNKSEFSKEFDATPAPLKRIRVQQNKEIVKQRKCIVEHPFGTIKRGLGIDYLLMRTIQKAEGELALAFLAFNIKRTINILGIQKLLSALV